MASNAERFRVNLDSEFRVLVADAGLFMVRRNEPLSWLRSNGVPQVGYLEPADRSACEARGWRDFYFTREEAEFRLALYLDPRTALSAFLKATGGSYEGSCAECNAAGLTNRGLYLATDPPGRKTCPTCRGTGGPPAHAGEISDWYRERGLETEAEVLRGLAQGE